jgi:hypothetical protein
VRHVGLLAGLLGQLGKFRKVRVFPRQPLQQPGVRLQPSGQLRTVTPSPLLVSVVRH